MKTSEIAEQLVAYCRKARWAEAQNALYAADAVSIEPYATPAFAKETKGLPAILEKGVKFESLVETMHSLKISEPLLADNAFAFTMSMDVTMKGQPRVKMSELCVYHVKDGKIVSEQFHM